MTLVARAGLGVAATIVVIAALPLPPAVTTAQEPTADRFEPPRTSWGDPDLQGIWTNTTSTPFERPEEYGTREFLTSEEFAEKRAEGERKAREAVEGDPAPVASGPEHWYEHLDKTSNRTSHVVDPPDGRVPALTSEAQTRPTIGTVNRDQFDSWTDLSAWDRCITRGVPGSMLPTFYNNNYQILQTPDYVVIFYEMIHDIDERGTNAADDRDGEPRPVRFLDRPECVGPVYHPRRTRVDAPDVLQQQLSDPSDTRLRGDLLRDDPRHPDCPVTRASPSPQHTPTVDGRLGWTLGRRHPRRRGRQLHRPDTGASGPRRGILGQSHERFTGRRAVHACRRRHDRLPVHRRRPTDVYDVVVRGHTDDESRRAGCDVRVRLS